MCWPFLRTTNKANDDSFTVSPRSRVKRTAGSYRTFWPLFINMSKYLPDKPYWDALFRLTSPPFS